MAGEGEQGAQPRGVVAQPEEDGLVGVGGRHAAKESRRRAVRNGRKIGDGGWRRVAAGGGGGGYASPERGGRGGAAASARGRLPGPRVAASGDLLPNAIGERGDVRVREADEHGVGQGEHGIGVAQPGEPVFWTEPGEPVFWTEPGEPVFWTEPGEPVFWTEPGEPLLQRQRIEKLPRHHLDVLQVRLVHPRLLQGSISSVPPRPGGGGGVRRCGEERDVVLPVSRREHREVDQQHGEGQPLQARVPRVERSLAQTDADDVAVERSVACRDDQHQRERRLVDELALLGAEVLMPVSDEPVQVAVAVAPRRAL